MRFATLASGSKGNALLVEHGHDLVLVDCGLSLTETARRMELLAADVADLTALMVTHEHSDHRRCLDVLARKTGLVPHMSAGTARALGMAAAEHVTVRADETVTLAGGLAVTPFVVPHDAKEPVMYRFAAGKAVFAVATDIGAPNAYLVRVLAGCRALVLECNYDHQRLADNLKYPAKLKERIRGSLGHLGNEQAGRLLHDIVHPGLHTVVAGHLSEENNEPTKVRAALHRGLLGTGLSPAIEVATQPAVCGWFEVVGA